MSTLSRDTSGEVERVLLELYRAKTPGERVELGMQTTAAMREVCEASIKRQYPLADGEEIRKRMTARWLGRDWAMRLYDWDPLQHGW